MDGVCVWSVGMFVGGVSVREGVSGGGVVGHFVAVFLDR